MPDDLPIYSDSVLLRSGIQFADLLRWKDIDTSPIWKKSDTFIAQMEGGKDIEAARTALLEPDKSGLIRAHAIIFSGSPGAGELRTSVIAGRYRGQDCPEPEFVNQSLDNFFNWMTAESIAEIHPIEKAALVLTRIVDIWPFASGNLTMAIVLANAFLRQAGMPPFFVLPEHVAEFEKAVAQAVTIETLPLVNAIHKTIKREIEEIAR
jgi:Fic family protein